MRPDKVNILGKVYTITYCDKPSDVDIQHRSSLAGQLDQWTGTIRIYDGNSEDEIFDTIVHEVLHGIVENLKMKTITDAQDYEDIISLLALGLADFLKRNDWMK